MRRDGPKREIEKLKGVVEIGEGAWVTQISILFDDSQAGLHSWWWLEGWVPVEK